MTHIWVLASGFFFANFMCLIAIWNNYSFNSLDPKYVGSSYDPNRKEELDSMLLKSVEKYIKKIFNIKTSLEETVKSDLNLNSSLFLGEPVGDNSTESYLFKQKLKNYQTIRNSESSKFSMFLDKEKENVLILKIANEENKINKYDSKNGEVILYTIPVENFIPSAFSKRNKNKVNFGSNDFENILNNSNGNGIYNKEEESNFSQKKKFLERSMIRECWNSRFFGRIIGAVASADKRKLSVFYSVVKGHTVTYRIRYFHDISCGNHLIKDSDAKMIENFNAYLDSSLDSSDKRKKASFIENYFEITEDTDPKGISGFKRGGGKLDGNEKNNFHKNNNDGIRDRNSNVSSEKDKIFKNYFDDATYDDFLLKGNTPITAMAIREDVIAYARDLDYRQYYVLKREKKVIESNLNLIEHNNNNNFNKNGDLNKTSDNQVYGEKDNSNDVKKYEKSNLTAKTFDNILNQIPIHNNTNESIITSTVWKVSSLGPKIDRKIQPFFHTNSLKFMDDPINDYRLIHIFVSLNSTDISCYGYFRISNHTDFNDNSTELTFTSIPFFKVFFINEILDGNEEFNLERSVKKLKKYLQPTLFSNNFNSQDMIFEFTKSYLLLMNSNLTNGNVHFIRMRPDTKEKIAKIHSDMENENIVIKYEGKKDMVYLLKEKLKILDSPDDAYTFTEYSKSISLKNLPKYYRSRQPLTYLIEKIKDKYIMILLNEDGILLSLDMSEVRNRIMGKGWLGFLTNFNWSTSLIMLFNIGTVIIYYHYSNMRLNRMGNVARRRENEINNVIQEIIRLNNLNLAYSANLIDARNNNPPESNLANVADENQNNNENLNNNNNINNSENDMNIENQNLENNNNNREENYNGHNHENQINDNDDGDETRRNDYTHDNRDSSPEHNDNEGLLHTNDEIVNNNNNNNNNNVNENLITIHNQSNNQSFTLDLSRNLNDILNQLNANINRNPNNADVRARLINNEISPSSNGNSDNSIYQNNVHNPAIDSLEGTQNKEKSPKGKIKGNDYELINLGDSNSNINNDKNHLAELSNNENETRDIVNEETKEENGINHNKTNLERLIKCNDTNQGKFGNTAASDTETLISRNLEKKEKEK